MANIKDRNALRIIVIAVTRPLTRKIIALEVTRTNRNNPPNDFSQQNLPNEDFTEPRKDIFNKGRGK
jgi:hypothetical protein